MPVYRVEDSQTGVVLDLEGDSPPTELELANIFSEYAASAAEPEDETTFGGQMYEAAKGIPRGLANSFLSAGEGLAQLADTVTDYAGLEDAIDSGDDNWLIEKARDARESINRSALGVDAAYRDKWTTKFGEGLGSFASFLTPAGAVKLLGYTGKLAPLITRGVPGAIAVGGGAGDQARRIEAAREAGVDVDDAQEAGAIVSGAFVGLTELIPVERLLRRIGKDASQSFKNKIYQAIKQGGVEGSQEVIASVMQDAIEKGVYNENLPEGGSLWDDFTVGGAVGFSADLVLNAAANRRRTTTTVVAREKEAELRELEDKMAADFREDMQQEETPVEAGPRTVSAAAVNALQLLEEDGIDPATIENPDEQAFYDPSTPSDRVNSIAADYGRRIARTMGPAFPNNTEFAVVEGEIVDTADEVIEGVTPEELAEIDRRAETVQFGHMAEDMERIIRDNFGDKAADRFNRRVQERTDEAVSARLAGREPLDTAPRTRTARAQTYIVTDSAGKQYGTPQLEYERAAQLAYSLDNQLIEQNVREAVKGILHTSQDNYTREQAVELYRYGVRVMHPDFNTVSSAAVNQAANTTIDQGYEEGLSAGEALESGKKLTAAQKINQKRLNRGLSETDSFTIKEAKSVLKEDFDKVGQYGSPQQFAQTAFGPVPITPQDLEFFAPFEDVNKTIDDADILRLLEMKNIVSEIDSREMKVLLKAIVGKTDIDKMNNNERRLLLSRLASMPRFSVLTKLPVFVAKPYTRQQFAKAVIAVELENNASIEVISAATGISLDEVGGKNKLNKIRQDLARQGLSQKELDKKQIEEEKAPPIAGLLTGPDNGLSELRARLRADLDQLGLKDIALRVDKELQGDLEAGPATEGYFQPSMKTIFLGLDNARLAEGATPEQREDAVASVMNHEMVHAMRLLDLWTAKEWFLLENLARRQINKQTATTYSDWAARTYSDLSEVGQMEEAIAEMFRHARRDNTVVTGKPRSLLKRIYDFIERLRSAMSGTGFQSFNDIVNRVNVGEIGARARGEIRTLRATEAEAGVAPERGIGRPITADDEVYEGTPVALETGQEIPDFLDSMTIKESRAQLEGMPLILPESKTRTALDALMKRTKFPTSKQLGKIPGAPKKKRGVLHKDVAPTDMRTLRHYGREGLRIAKNIRWYDQFALGIRNVVGPANVEEASIVFGITSQQQPPEMNLSDTYYIMRTAREIDPVTNPEGFRAAIKKPKPNGNKVFAANDQIDRIIRMYKEGIVRGGLKTTTYAQLTRDRIDNVFNPYSVQDVHMARLFGYRTKKRQGKRIVDDARMPTSQQAYNYAEYLTSMLARENNVTPDQMQAALWFYGKNYLSPASKREGFDGTWESAYDYSKRDREAIEAQVEQGIFDKNAPLTPALAEGIKPVFRRGTGEATKEIPIEDVRPRFTEQALEQAPELRLEAAPGNARGYGFPSWVTMKQKVDFNNRAIEEMTDAENQIPTLRMMGIPHEVKSTYGTYDAGLVPGISIKLSGGNLEQASMAASVLGDALLQDSAVTMQPSYNDGGNVGFAVRKANREAFTEDELVVLAESVNPGHDPEGLNFSQTEPDTAIFMDSRQYWDKTYDFDTSLKEFYDDLAAKLPASLDLVTGAYTQYGDYIESKDYQKGITKIRDQGITARRSDLYQRINDTLYQPLWDLYTKEAADLKFTPKNTLRPTITDILGVPIVSDIKPLPREGVDAAVKASTAKAEAVKAGGVPLYSAKASEDAQYIAQNPEKGESLPESLRTKFSRKNTVPLDDTGEAVKGRLIGGKGEKDITPGETYLQAAQKDFFGTFSKIMQRFRAAAVNSYAAIEKLNKDLGRRYPELKGLLADCSSIAAVLFADRSRGVLAAALKDGVVTYENGVTKVRPFVHKGKRIRGLIELLAPLYNTPSGENLEDLAQMYAISRRSDRLNDQGVVTVYNEKEEAQRQNDKRWVEAKVKEYINPETGRPIVEEWYEAWQAYNQHTVRFLVNTGVLNAKEGTHWLQHADYYPFYKQDHEKIDIRAPVGQSGASAKPIDVPMLDAITRNLSTAIDLGMRNVARQRVVRDAVTMGLARDADEIPITEGDKVVNFRVNGVARRFIIDDPLLYESLNILADTGLGPIASLVLGGPSSLLRAMVTREPGFLIANMLRDTLSAYATSGADITPVLDTLSGFTDGMETLSSYGVVGGYDFKDDPADIVKFIARESRRRGTNVGKLGKVEELFEFPGLKMFKQAWHVSGQASTLSDAATRNAVYNDVLARTGNEAEAAFQALEVINFSRRGGNIFLRHVFAATPFLNARIQGLDVLYRSFIKGSYSANRELSNKMVAATAWKRGIYLTGLTVLYYTMISDDDEYDKASQHERDNYWLFPRFFGEDTPPLRIPIPFEVGVVFKMIPERILDNVYGETTPRQLRQSMERAVRSTFEVDPVYNTALWGPFLEAYTNKNAYTGQAIVPEWMNGDDVEPGLISFTQTNVAADLIGKKIDVSPLKIEHMVKGYTGTLGNYALSMIDSTLRRGLDYPVLPKKELYEYPLVKRFFTSKEGRGLQEQFYELKNETDKFTNSLNYLVKNNRLDEYEAYRASKSYLYDVKLDVDALSKSIRRLRKYKNSILSSDLFDAEYKAEVKRNVDAEINTILQGMPELMRRAKLPTFGGN